MPTTQTRDRLADLRTMLAQLNTDEGWLRWLTARAKLHTYSMRNQMLISLQCPDATMIRGFRAWEEEQNRRVRKGEKAIYILAPARYPVRDDNGDQVRDDGVLQTRMAFRAVGVFDISQTDPIPGKPLVESGIERVKGGQLAHLVESLAHACMGEGIADRVYFNRLEGQAGGWFRHEDSTICIDTRPDPDQQFGTLVHEMAHALEARGEERDYEFQELVAEAVAWTVCDGQGVDRGAFASRYIASWQRDAPEKLTQAADEINRRASRIEEVIDVL